jgi:hypothetical protein
MRQTGNEKRGRERSSLTWEESVKRYLNNWCITKELILDRREWNLAINMTESWYSVSSLLLSFYQVFFLPLFAFLLSILLPFLLFLFDFLSPSVSLLFYSFFCLTWFYLYPITICSRIKDLIVVVIFLPRVTMSIHWFLIISAWSHNEHSLVFNLCTIAIAVDLCCKAWSCDWVRLAFCVTVVIRKPWRDSNLCIKNCFWLRKASKPEAFALMFFILNVLRVLYSAIPADMTLRGHLMECSFLKARYSICSHVGNGKFVAVRCTFVLSFQCSAIPASS